MAPVDDDTSSVAGVGRDDALASQLLEEIDSLLGRLHATPSTRVTLDSDLTRDLGVDSLALVELLDQLEQSFNVELSDDVFTTARTPRDWLEALRRARGDESPRVVTAPSPARLRRDAGEPWPRDATTLIEALTWHVDAHPDQICIRHLPTGEVTTFEDITYAQLDRRARVVASGIRASGVVASDRVAIMLATGPDFFVAYLGVVLAGAVPVPIYPPAQLHQIEAHLGRQSRILDNAGARMLVTMREAKLAARLLRTAVASLRHVTTVEALTELGGQPLELPTVAAADVALIQYTSGSTGDPKGVVITNEQLVANITSMGDAARIDTSDLVVSWLPLYHDMGLIGCWHTPLFFGVPLVVMSPLAFLAHPARWLRAISTFQATLTVGPNFAYQRCVDKVSVGAPNGLDLSSLRVAICGSEPVSPATIEAFSDRFAACGFDPMAFCPAYGLAEMGVGVAFTDVGHGPVVDAIDRDALRSSGVARVVLDDDSALRLVGCGRPLEGYAIRIVGADGDILPERHEGAITCRGPSATQGYFNNERATQALWHDGWLETGDLGYVADGQLFVTGRSKDVIIRAGRNLHPEELEEALGALDGVDARSVAVLSRACPRTGTAQIVVVVETTWSDERRRRELEGVIGERARDVLGVSPDEIVLVPPGSLVRTASGKLRRSATVESLDDGTLAHDAPPVTVQLARFALTGIRPMMRDAPRFARQCVRDVTVAVVVVPAGVLAWMISVAPLSMRRRAGAARRLGRWMCRTLGIDLEVKGDLLPAPPVIMAANHESLIDGIVMFILCDEPVVFVTSVELRRVRFVGTLLERYGCVFVQRGRASEGESAVATLVDVVRSGRRLVIFPEGSLSGATGLRSFHLGAFDAAAAVPCPVVPVAITGTRDVVAPGTWHVRTGTVRVVAGDPITPDGDDLDARVALRDATRAAIGALERTRRSSP